MKEDRSLKTIMRSTLKKPTLQENIEEIDNRIFYMEMSDELDNETWNIIKVLKEIKKEFEEELKCKTSK
jgi:RNAse (barnase) inhibitor barstar